MKTNSRVSLLFGFSFFLLATVLTGLTLRWQLAGFTIPMTGGLDWRRAHSHLGFYGVLFPMTWLCLKAVGLWSPNWKLWSVYVVFVAIAGLSFLAGGYNLVSILASTGILSMWLIYAWQTRPSNLQSEQSQWMQSSSAAVLLAALLIPCVAVLTHRAPEIANQTARTFLTLLLFGVFVPSGLRLMKTEAPPAWLWLLLTILSSLFLTGLVPSPWMGGGLVGLSGLILKSFFDSHQKKELSQDLRLKVAWILFAISFGLTGLRILPYTYFQAIAGIHFLILGPILMTFAFEQLNLKVSWPIRVCYELSLLTMVLAISLQAWVPISLTRVAALAGTLIVLCIALVVLSRLRALR